MNITQTNAPETETEELDFMVAKGRRYKVNCMPIAYAHEYLTDTQKFITAEDGNVAPVMLNFVRTDGRADGEVYSEDFLKKWIPRLLEYQGRPATLEMLYEAGWDIGDLNTFLKKALCISE